LIELGYGNKKTILSHLESHVVKERIHNPRSIHLVVDATYFGKKKDDSSWGVILFRDPVLKENLWWMYIDTERESYYRQGRVFLESLGYTILSVTCDGFSENIPVFKGIPIQMCHFNMKQIVIRNVTLKPQTEAGQVLLALIKTITYTDELLFRGRLREFHFKYASFMNEKTYHPNGSSSYTHEGVKRAYISITNWFDYLFTYQNNSLIPNTTNTCDGHFSHIKDIIRIHRGLNRKLKQKVLDSILFESTIAPKLKKK